MEKKNFYLTKKQLQNLNIKAEETGITVSEMLRRIIDEFFSSKDNTANDEKNVHQMSQN